MSRTDQTNVMRAVETQFTSYFLEKLGPSERSEAKRKTIFELIKSVVDKVYSKYFQK